LLHLAAVLGRQMDLDLLRFAEPSENLDGWLTTLADAAVLEIHAGRWRFAHDRLRQGVLDELADDVRPRLHRRAAEAIEAVYPGDAGQVAALAHHWANAEDTQKAIDSLETAGHQALQNYANEVAIAFYSQALALDDKAEARVDRVRRARWELRLGEAYVNQSTYTRARRHLAEGYPYPRTIAAANPAPPAAQALCRTSRGPRGGATGHLTCLRKAGRGIYL
jgi:predicted ATPase